MRMIAGRGQSEAVRVDSFSVASLQDPIDSVRFQERLGILIADMECFVGQLQWVAEQVHRTRAMDDKSCMLLSPEEELRSSTSQTRDGQLLQSTKSSRHYISSVSGKVAKRHWTGSSSGDLSSGGELSETDSDSDLMTDSKHEAVFPRTEAHRDQQDRRPRSILVEASKTVPNLPRIRESALSLEIEIVKVDAIRGMPRTPSSKLLTNIWGTSTRDALPRKQSEASDLKVSIENKLEKLLGRRRLNAGKFSTSF